MNQGNNSIDFPIEANKISESVLDKIDLQNKIHIELMPAAIPVVEEPTKSYNDDLIAPETASCCKNVNTELSAQHLMEYGHNHFESKITKAKKRSNPKLDRNDGDVSQILIINGNNTKRSIGVHKNKRTTVKSNYLKGAGDGCEMKIKDAYNNHKLENALISLRSNKIMSKMPKDGSRVKEKYPKENSEPIYDVDIKKEGEETYEQHTKNDDKIIENTYSTVSDNYVPTVVLDLDVSFTEDDATEHSSSDVSVDTFLEEEGASADVYDSESSINSREGVEQQTENCVNFQSTPYNYASSARAFFKTEYIDLDFDDDHLMNDHLKIKIKDAYYNRKLENSPLISLRSNQTMSSKLFKDGKNDIKKDPQENAEHINDFEIKKEGGKIIENKYSTVRVSDNYVPAIVPDSDGSFSQDDVAEHSSSDVSVDTFLEEEGASADVYNSESSINSREDAEQQTENCVNFQATPYIYASSTPARFKTEFIDVVFDDDQLMNDPVARLIVSL